MAQLAPVLKHKFTDSNDEPLAGGKLYTYQAGTTTPLATYTSQAGTSANTNPIILDANGECDLWLSSAGAYKFVLTDSADVTQWTVDNVRGSSAEANDGFESLSVDNLSLDGNTIASTDTNGNIVLSPNGTGKVRFSSATVSTVPYFDANKDLVSSSVTPTELGYLSGVTSAIQAQLNTGASNLSAHIADTTDAHAASAITNTPSGNLAATTVQAALNELQADVDTRATSASVTSAIATHEADTTSVHGIADTSALSLKSATETLSGKTFSDPLTLDGQASTPASPSAGFYKLYAKDDGKVYKLDSSGTEAELGAGAGGSGGKNYLSALYSGESVSGINTYADAASASATDGTGGSPSVSAAALNTSTPLRGSSSIRLSKGAANEQGEGWSYDFTLDRADYEGGKPVVIQFRYKTSANYASGDVRMFVYDKDGTTLLSVVSLTGDGSINASSNTTLYTGVFYPNSSNNDYRLIFHITSTNASAWDLDLIDLKVGPDSTVPAAIATDWQTYTPTGSWTVNSTYTGRWRRVGDSMEVMINVALSGAPNAVDLEIHIPTQFAINTSNLIDSVGNPHIEGQWVSHDSGSHGSASGNKLLYISSYSVKPLTEAGGNITTTAPFTWGNGDNFLAYFKVPIVGWSASAALSTTETMLSTVKARYTSNAGNSVPNNSVTIIDFEDRDYDPASAVTTGASWKFTAPKTAYYRVSANIAYASSTSWDAGENAFIYIFKNGNEHSRYALYDEVATVSRNMHVSVNDTVYLTAGQYIDIRAYQNSGAAHSLDSNGSAVRVAIEEVPDFSIFSVYGITEYKESKTGSSASWPITASQWGDLTSLSLDPGEWELTASLQTNNSAAVTASNLGIGISTTSGNSTSGLSFGENRLVTYNAGTSGIALNLVIPRYRVVVTSTTTYYFKATYGNTITNLEYLGYAFTARRIK